jgi:hypothetical protein
MKNYENHHKFKRLTYLPPVAAETRLDARASAHGPATWTATERIESAKRKSALE